MTTGNKHEFNHDDDCESIIMVTPYNNNIYYFKVILACI